MRRASIWSGLGTAALIALASLPALAQTAAAPKPGAPAKPPNAQAKLPYDVTADQQEVFNDEHRTVYRGNVVAIQGTDRLNTPQLTIISAKKDPATTKAPAAGAPASAADTFGKIERMEAEGPVYFNTPTQNAKGDHGTYIAADDTITLTGNVVLVQNKDVSTGDKLIYQKSTGHAQLYSKVGAAPQRVRGVFYQDDAPTPPAAAPGAPAPAKAAPPAKPSAKPKTKGKTTP
jgi:lipopolysaccharide export system protein LptA